MVNKKNLFLSIVLFFVSLIIFVFNVACDNLVPANEPTKYIITAKAGNNGKIIPEGEISLVEGQGQSFTIISDEGYEIINILVDGVSIGINEKYTFYNINENHTIEAIFQKKQLIPSVPEFTITATAEIGGTIEPSGNINYKQGERQTFIITPDQGYQIINILIDDEPEGILEEFTFEDINHNHKIHASFIPNYTITATADKNGSINPQGQLIITEGEDQTFKIIASTGYEILNVLVDGNSVGAVSEYTIENIQTNHTITASFALKQFTIASSAGDRGSISPSGETVVNWGNNKSFTITANNGYQITDIKVDSTSLEDFDPTDTYTYNFTDIQANHTIEAFFMQQFTITASAENNGSIEPSGEITVLQGQSKIFTIIPDTCYLIEKININGVEELGIKSPYTITNIKQDYYIIVSFTLSDKRIRRYNQAGDLQHDDYTSIQTAIDDSLDGDTIIVCPGTYNENIEFDNTNIILSSINPEDPDIVAATVIDGGGEGSVISFINGSESVLQGFTVICGTGTLVGGYTAGGGIYIDNSNPRIFYNVIENNKASHGGGIYLMESPFSIIEENKIRKNKGTNKGGGIYAHTSSPNIIGNTINENSAGNGSAVDEFGGGIYVYGGYVDSVNSIISNSIYDNEANDNGGGIYLSGSSPKIKINNINNNATSKNGGGICLRNNSSPDISSENNINGNSAGENGGGIFMEYSYNASIKNNVIENNKATYSGGGLYILNSSPVISENTIGGDLDNIGNTARWGGGICVTSSVSGVKPTTINKNIIKNNKADNFGGGVFVNPNSILLPDAIRTNGWGKLGNPDFREDIPVKESDNLELIPPVEDDFSIAENVFKDNKHGNPLDYSEGAHVYYQ